MGSYYNSCVTGTGAVAMHAWHVLSLVIQSASGVARPFLMVGHTIVTRFYLKSISMLVQFHTCIY